MSAGTRALTRRVGPRLPDCELTFLARQPIDVALARRQHAAYEQALGRLGVEVVSLDPLPDLPDAVFVEDTAVVLAEVAVILPLGTPGRHLESEAIAGPLGRYRPLHRLVAPARIEGGDVLAIDRRLLVGRSGRSDAHGYQALAAAVCGRGYALHPVSVRGCLHLKTACSYLGGDTLLVNPAWIDTRDLPADLRLLGVPAEEPWAANCLKVGDRLVMPAGFPRTRELLERAGFAAETVDLSELAKAEAGPTCLALLFSD